MKESPPRLLRQIVLKQARHSHDVSIRQSMRSGQTPASRPGRLCSIMGQDFELPISIEEMISKLDVGGSGEIAFDELQAVFSERKNVV
jgi:hypothetical protein